MIILKIIDLTGQRFGKLIVLERDYSKKNGTYWKCQCDCGNICVVRRDQLTREKNPKRCCGCDVKRRNSEAHLKNEVGNRYGKLVVIKRTSDLKKGEARWLCKCDCGNITEVSGLHLRNGTIQSCGCKRYESHNGIDETGNIYGDLVVLHRSDKTDGSHIFWHCKCSCGNECDINGTYLRNGVSTNCGCKRSVGESKISKILKENCINFKREYTFPDLLGDGGGRLRFDFAIFDDQNNLQYLIEFDGIQHFEKNCFGKEENDFNILKKYDIIKNEYCKKNNLILIRIPYTKLKDLSLQDLLLNKEV